MIVNIDHDIVDVLCLKIWLKSSTTINNMEYFMSGNNQDTYQAMALFFGLIFACFCLFILDRSNATGIPFFVLMKTSISLIVVFIGFLALKHWGLFSPILYPLTLVFIVVSLFPILNHYALLKSEKVFHDTVDILGRTKQELSAIEITVIWASMYMKALYLAIAFGIGVLIQRSVNPEDDWF